MKRINLLYLIYIFTSIVLPQITLAQSAHYPFQDPKLSFEARVNDLVERLSLEEKVSQMLSNSPKIVRLGIPAYNWWNETLHGVARTQYHTTVFPQAIAMAATFDKTAILKMGDYSAMEGRAIYNKAKAANQLGKRYEGLTYWTPNINIFRDPRWGRGQETYGEDPYLTATLGDAFVRGLQGDDPKYLKAAACAKHFAVHSGPEPLRHSFDVNVSAHDLWDTYLPAFRKLVVDSKVAGVMCAYNAFRTQPCCASDILMNDILRNQWKFTGYVTSDCGGIEDFFTQHKTHPNATSAAVDAVIHTTDVECGHDVYLTLVQAVKDKKISEEVINTSIKRLFLIRFKLGLFDPENMVKYAQTPASELESPQHGALALDMAQKSMVLLKNDGVLPLKKNLKKIVVLGPNADNAVSILGNYNGTPTKLTTVLQGIKNKVAPGSEVVFEPAITFTGSDLLNYNTFGGTLSVDGKKGFRADYFKNMELKGEPFITQIENGINHNWQEGEKVAGELVASDFSARYTTALRANTDQNLSLELEADNGCRMFINDKLAIDQWHAKPGQIKKYNLSVKKDSSYKIVIEYWQSDASAYIRFNIGNYVRTDFARLAEKYKDADVFVVAGGISPELEGESMQVNAPGFSGGDRTSILLPEVQTELMKALRQTGKPVVFVMMTGAAIATPWESKNVPAILNAWYGGQAAGSAVADILFGDYNPSGRLPVTFYSSDNDLADFTDYTMKNRTYRYFRGTPAYGFGYGLSYTKFQYKILSASAKKNSGVTITAQISNTGLKNGDEVAQLYLLGKKGDIAVPLKALKGFQRINIKAKDNKIVKFNVSPEQLIRIMDDGTAKNIRGRITFSLGGCQPDESNPGSGNIVFANVNIL